MRRVVCLLVLCLPWAAFALPDQFFQEGLVTDADNRPVEGEHRVRVRLFDVERGGQALFDEIHEDVPFVGGYYAIAIGSVAELDAALFRRGRLYMALSIDNGDELDPRTPIVKVPAAFAADVASNATGDITPRTVSIPGFGMVIDQNGRWVGDPAGLGGGGGDDEGDTPAQILAKLRAVDGADSGLDADRFDGQDSSAFVRTAEQVLERLRGVDGRGSGVDADRLDGLDSTAFVRTAEEVRDRLQEVDGQGSGVDADRLDGFDSSQFVRTAAQVRDLLRQVDGAGSALDADRLDGLDSTVFMRADRDTGTAGNLTVRNGIDVGGAGAVGGTLEVGALRVQGRVGIGVGDPGVALDVDGEVRATATRVDHVQLAARAAPPADPAEGMVYYDRARGVQAFDGQRWRPLSRGVLQGGDDACDAAMAGTIRWSGAAFEGCDGEAWTPFGQGGGGGGGPGPGGEAATAGLHCLDLQQQGVEENGVYWIDPDGGNPGNAFQAYCDMLTDGGGWTLVARTVVAGLTPAQRDAIRRGGWDAYSTNGYGSPDPDSPIYWMPLRHWNTLTARYPNNTFWSRTSRDSVRMRGFTVGAAAAGHPWDWAGTVAGHRSLIDAMRGARFTTHDRDNDIWGRNCASQNVGFNGGFWYTNCYQLSMLHSNGNLYALYSNVDHRVDFNEVYLRPNPEPARPDAFRRSCLQILQNDESEGSGRYWIDPNGGNSNDAVLTWCDMETDGGGWTMVAKTVEAALGDAERQMIWRGTWADYTTNGYGSSAEDSGAFWMPLAQWRGLTELHPNNTFWSQTNRADVKMSNFRIGTEAQAYPWSWNGVVAGNQSLINDMRGARFTTHDRDNDIWGRNCARDNVGFNGGFWYTNCYQLSMLHSNGRIYALYSNVDHRVEFNRLYIR